MGCPKLPYCRIPKVVTAAAQHVWNISTFIHILTGQAKNPMAFSITAILGGNLGYLLKKCLFLTREVAPYELANL
jgi:hypothetical protein